MAPSRTGTATTHQLPQTSERITMRRIAFALALVFSLSGTAAAQEWDQYVNTQDGFKINFPGQPKVTTITWKSQMDYVLPGRVYSADKGREHYALTVVDYTTLEQQGI